MFERALGRADELAAAPPMAPDGWCVYSVGDIHGERGCLERLMSLIGDDIATLQGLRPVIVFLGDYVDRGPDSRGVLDMLCAMRDRAAKGQGPACRFLRGNHEEALLAFLSDPAKASEWLRFGGVETLASYGVRASVGSFDSARCRSLAERFAEQLPAAHRNFLEDLEPMVQLGDYAFIHAGVKPGVSLDRQQPEDLFWIREPFLSSRKYHGKTIVHGHTVVEQPVILPNRIAIDTGAYATGRLTVIALHGLDKRVIQTAPWGVDTIGGGV